MEKCSVRDAALKLAAWFSISMNEQSGKEKPRAEKPSAEKKTQPEPGKPLGVDALELPRDPGSPWHRQPPTTARPWLALASPAAAATGEGGTDRLA